jgi:hypothetical protein
MTSVCVVMIVKLVYIDGMHLHRHTSQLNNTRYSLIRSESWAMLPYVRANTAQATGCNKSSCQHPHLPFMNNTRTARQNGT